MPWCVFNMCCKAYFWGQEGNLFYANRLVSFPQNSEFKPHIIWCLIIDISSNNNNIVSIIDIIVIITQPHFDHICTKMLWCMWLNNFQRRSQEIKWVAPSFLQKNCIYIKHFIFFNLNKIIV